MKDRRYSSNEKCQEHLQNKFSTIVSYWLYYHWNSVRQSVDVGDNALPGPSRKMRRGKLIAISFGAFR